MPNDSNECLSLVERAREFAIDAHQGQQYEGKPYAEHLFGVVEFASHMLPPHFSPEWRIEILAVAWLHDILHTNVELYRLSDSFGIRISDAVRQLTHDTDIFTYAEYIREIPKNEIALCVKLAELAFDIDYCRRLIERHQSLCLIRQNRLEKYELAEQFLQQRAAVHFGGVYNFDINTCPVCKSSGKAWTSLLSGRMVCHRRCCFREIAHPNLRIDLPNIHITGGRQSGKLQAEIHMLLCRLAITPRGQKVAYVSGCRERTKIAMDILTQICWDKDIPVESSAAQARIKILDREVWFINPNKPEAQQGIRFADFAQVKETEDE